MQQPDAVPPNWDAETRPKIPIGYLAYLTAKELTNAERERTRQRELEFATEQERTRQKEIDAAARKYDARRTSSHEPDHRRGRD